MILLNTGTLRYHSS